MGGGTATRSAGQTEGPCQRDSRQVVLSSLESLRVAWAPGWGDPMVRTGGPSMLDIVDVGGSSLRCIAGSPPTIAGCRGAHRAGAARRPGAAPERDPVRRRRVGAAALGGAPAQRSGARGGLAHHQRRRALLQGDQGDPQRSSGSARESHRRRQGPLPGDLARERGRVRLQLRFHLRPRSPAGCPARVHRQGEGALDLAVPHRHGPRQRRRLEFSAPVPGRIRRVDLHDARIRTGRSAHALPGDHSARPSTRAIPRTWRSPRPPRARFWSGSGFAPRCRWSRKSLDSTCGRIPSG